jgi:hypothetical protein
MRACVEIEANCKAILFENGYHSKRDLNMSDYKKLNKTHHLSSFQVRLPVWQGSANVRTPFQHWQTGQSLPWYKAYNDVKHSRHQKFQQSNFQNMLDAMCGVVAILGSQFVTIDFGPEAYVGLSSRAEGYEIAIGGYFEIRFPDDWSADEWYTFDWHALVQGDAEPFQELQF